MKNNLPESKLTRRRFLAVTGLALAAPTVVPGRAWGQEAKIAPSNRITMGIVGAGWQGTNNMNAFLGLKECQVVAICDLDRDHLTSAQAAVNRQNTGLMNMMGLHQTAASVAKTSTDTSMTMDSMVMGLQGKSGDDGARVNLSRVAY